MADRCSDKGIERLGEGVGLPSVLPFLPSSFTTSACHPTAIISTFLLSYSKGRIGLVVPLGSVSTWSRGFQSSSHLLERWVSSTKWKDFLLLITQLSQSSGVCDTSGAITQTSCERTDLRPIWEQRSLWTMSEHVTHGLMPASWGTFPSGSRFLPPPLHPNPLAFYIMFISLDSSRHVYFRNSSNHY